MKKQSDDALILKTLIGNTILTIIFISLMTALTLTSRKDGFDNACINAGKTIIIEQVKDKNYSIKKCM